MTVNTRPYQIYLALGAVAIAVYYLMPSAGVGQAVVLTVANASGAVCALRAASKTRGRPRVVWVSLGLAMTFATLANGPYYAFPLVTGHPTPFPCPVDLLWLSTYPCFMVALAALAGQRRRDDRGGDALDAAIVVVTGGSLMWEFVIDPVVRASGLPVLAHIVAIAYPTMDLVVFAFLVRLVVAASSRSGSMRLLVGSFIFLLLADTVYALELSAGSYHFGGPTDGLWMASYLLIGIAAVHPAARAFTRRETASRHVLSRQRLVFLGCAVLTGPILVAAHPTHLRVIACSSALSFLLVMARVRGLNRRLVQASGELESRASTDSLTGLANRAAFHSRLTAALADPDQPARSQAVLFVDLDDFKDVNDTLGHGAGDRLLQVIAQRLSEAVRPGDLVARLGGDEFAVLLDKITDPAIAVDVAERTVRALAAPAEINGTRVHVGASVGLTVRRRDSDPVSLMREADVAMYTAKRSGKNQVARYDEEVDQAIADHHALKVDIVGAASRDELVLDYQPVVELHSGRMVGVEALVRWQHPTRGLLPPSTFITIAEETGAIVDIGASVLETACRQAHIWRHRHAVSEFVLSVNVSVRQLDEPGFTDLVRQVLRRTGLDPTCLVLEITESVLADTSGRAAESLESLRQIGVRIAIDDFGTGFSSIDYLRRLPVDILKIDRSFVSGENRGPKGDALLGAIVALSQRLGLEVIPEGIEETGQLMLLQSIGCRIGQGYLMSRPVTPATIDTLLRRHPLPTPQTVEIASTGCVAV